MSEENIEEDQQHINNTELRASFYRIMEACEEFNEESKWSPAEIVNLV